MVWFTLKRLCLDKKWLHVPFPDHGRDVVVFVPHSIDSVILTILGLLAWPTGHCV